MIFKTKVKRTGERIGRLMAVCLVFACMTGPLFTSASYAAGTEQVTLTVSQVIAGDIPCAPPDQAFTYRLTPKTAGAPMPAGSGPEGYTFTILGTVEAQIGPIDFYSADICSYELSCVTGGQDAFTADPRAYTIDIYAENGMPPVTIVRMSDNAKAAEISFTHTYTAPPDEPDIPAGPVEPASPVEPAGPVGHGSPANSGRAVDLSSLSRANVPNNPGYLSDLGDLSAPGDPGDPGNTNSLGNPDTAGNPNSTDSPGTHIVPGFGPVTGDLSNPGLWIALIVICGIFLIPILWKSRKSSPEPQRAAALPADADAVKSHK